MTVFGFHADEQVMTPGGDGTGSLPAMNRRKRNTDLLGDCLGATKCFDDVWDACHNPIYDNHILQARANTTFVLDERLEAAHQTRVESSTELLARLKAAGVTQVEIAKALNMQQPNVAMLYSTKKPRALKWDEGLKLREAFADKLGNDEEPARTFTSAETLAPILDALLPLVPRSGLTDQSVGALSEAVAYGLRLLGESGSNPESGDALRVAARGAASRFRDLSLQ